MADAARLGDRDRLARQRRFVDRCGVRVDDAVDRNDFAGVHQQPVADGDGGYRHFLDTAFGEAMRLARRAVDQRAQIALGAGNRDVLEHVAAGIHQRHDGAGQRLAERDRRTHRHQRDRIDTEPPGQQVARRSKPPVPRSRAGLRASSTDRRSAGRPASAAAIPAASPAIAIATSAHRMTRSNDIGAFVLMPLSGLSPKMHDAAIEGNQSPHAGASAAFGGRSGVWPEAITWRRPFVIASAGRLASSACSVLMVE